MISRIWERLFGKWVEIRSYPGSGKFSRISTLTGELIERDIRKQGFFIIEENTKTKKQRAWFELDCGKRQPLSVRFVESLMKGEFPRC